MRMNFKKNIIIIFLIAFLLTLGVTTIEANSGPPSNVQIEIINSDVNFNYDLLIDVGGTPQQVSIDEALLKIADGDYDHITTDTDFLVFMTTYQDSDGYVSNLFYGDPDYIYSGNTDQSFFIRMYLNVPKEFKLLLYTEDEKIITSELITMSQFDLRLTYDLTGVDMSINQNGVGEVSGYVDNPWGNFTTWFNFFLRMILTVFIELGVLYLFGFRKKSTFLFITLMNVVSQVLLNIALINAFYNNPSSNSQYLFAFIGGEFLVFTIEAIIVASFIKEHKILRRMGYSFIANAASLLIGLLLASSLSFLI